MTQEEGADVPREHGWRGPLLGLLAVLVLSAAPPFTLLLPVDQFLLLLAPALALCAVAGWRKGGRWTLAAVWTVFAVWTLWVPGELSPFDLLVRGWSVVLAASFAGTLVVGGSRPFLPRALLAILATLVVTTAAVATTADGFAAVQGVLADAFTSRGQTWLAEWRRFTTQPEWQEMARENASAVLLAKQLETQFTLVPAAAKVLVPATIALQSLAALALSWALYHRFGRARLGPPLTDLRDLRFHDAFVWGVIAGLLVLVVPMPDTVAVLGVNSLVFFGALFALRGLGVLIWFVRPERWTAVLWSLVLVLFWKFFAAVALVIGVGDTWLDWRRRPRPQSQRSE